MRFAIAYTTRDRKRFLIVAELIETGDDFEQWNIRPKDALDKAVIVQSDRPKQLRKSSTSERFNWTKEDKPVSGHLHEIMRMVEWRILFETNPGYAGVFPKDAFPLDP